MEDKEIEDGEEIDFLFVVDNIPQNESDVPEPRFKSKFQVLSGTDENEPVQKKRKVFVQNCFNCGSDKHGIRDCPEPRDHREITRNKKIFMDNKVSNNKTGPFQRYHIDEEQRYDHFKPGTISKNLRTALGITSYQLPPYIYNMRQLGYPLGWIEEIKISHSGISMFDGDGKEVTNPGEEEGEVVNPAARDKYDVRKIISYPGFNVQPPSKVKDEYERFGAPPLHPWQSKEALIEALRDKEQSENYHNKFHTDVPTQVDDNNQPDMDFEHTPEVGLLPEDNCGFVPPLPDSVDQPPPPPDDVPSVNENSLTSTSSHITDDEESLQNLELRKNELLAELNDTSCTSTPPNKNLGKIKTVELGTPVLKSVSPFARLPTANSFSVDICDVINFENLPDSTGKYEKMSGLIRKVRTEVSKLQAGNK